VLHAHTFDFYLLNNRDLTCQLLQEQCGLPAKVVTPKCYKVPYHKKWLRTLCICDHTLRNHIHAASPQNLTEYEALRQCSVVVLEFILCRGPSLRQNTNTQQWTLHICFTLQLTILNLVICQKGHVKYNKDIVQMACSLLQYGSGFGWWCQSFWTQYPQQKKWSKHLPVQVPCHLTTYSSNNVNWTTTCEETPDKKNLGIYFFSFYSSPLVYIINY
jgi:hypothetical protein